MTRKHLIVAVLLTVLTGIPLYVMSSNNFQLNLNNFPLILLSLFVPILISCAWSAAISTHTVIANPNDRESGKVKWFNASKGFGFITRDSGDDVFVHFRSIRGKGHRVLKDGQRVEFIVSENEKGLQAEDVAVAR